MRGDLENPGAKLSIIGNIRNFNEIIILIYLFGDKVIESDEIHV